MVNSQKLFALNIFDVRQDGICALIESHGLAPEKRLQVYRNNYRVGLQQALKSTYPAIFNMVGEAYFKQLASRYIQENPSTSANIIDYGAHIPELLKCVPEADQYPWFGDLAQLEWSVHQSYYAADTDVLTLQMLENLKTSEYDKLSLNLHPSCWIMTSDFDLESLWQLGINPNKDAQDSCIDKTPRCFLVVRKQKEVCVKSLQPIEFTFISQLSNGVLLGDAVEKLFTQNSNINLQALLAKQLSDEIYQAI